MYFSKIIFGICTSTGTKKKPKGKIVTNHLADPKHYSPAIKSNLQSHLSLVVGHYFIYPKYQTFQLNVRHLETLIRDHFL